MVDFSKDMKKAREDMHKEETWQDVAPGFDFS